MGLAVRALLTVALFGLGIGTLGFSGVPQITEQQIAPLACDNSYPDFCIPPPPPDLNCNSPAIAGRHNFTVRPPDPHHFDTDHDGKGCEAALNDTPTPTPISSAIPSATPTATPIVGGPVSCAPRPPVRVSVIRTGPGQLQATLSAASNLTGGKNSLNALTFRTITNAAVQVVGVGPAMTGQRVALAAGTQTVTLQVTQLTSGQGVFVPLAVSDGCGDWQTFVGAGPNAL